MTGVAKSKFWQAKFKSATPGFLDVHLIIASNRTEAMAKVQDIISRKSGPVFVELTNETDIIEKDKESDDIDMNNDDLAAANRADDLCSEYGGGVRERRQRDSSTIRPDDGSEDGGDWMNGDMR